MSNVCQEHPHYKAKLRNKLELDFTLVFLKSKIPVLGIF